MSDRSLNPVADMAKNGRIENLFPTPLFSHVLKNVDSLNAELRDLILERERTRPSAGKSNIGGWQSEADFLTWGDVATTLGRYMVTAVEIATRKLPLVAPNLKISFELIAWAAVNRKGHYNTSHVHPTATWSGVYYVDPGDEPVSGPRAVLEFEHPIQAMVMNFFPGLLPSTLIVRPGGRSDCPISQFIGPQRPYLPRPATPHLRAIQRTSANRSQLMHKLESIALERCQWHTALPLVLFGAP